MPENQPSAGFAKGLVKAWEMYNQPEYVSKKEFICNSLLDRNFKALADDRVNVASIRKFLFEGQKTLLEEKKMLVTSIFFSSHNVFKIF